MRRGNCTFLQQRQLFGERVWFNRASFRAQTFEILDDASFVLCRDAVGRVILIAEFRCGVDEGTTVKPQSLERLSREPRLHGIEHCEQPLIGLLRGLLHLSHEPIPELLVAPAKHRENQFVFGAEMIVERHLGNTRLRKNSFDPLSAAPL